MEETEPDDSGGCCLIIGFEVAEIAKQLCGNGPFGMDEICFEFFKAQDAVELS